MIRKLAPALLTLTMLSACRPTPQATSGLDLAGLDKSVAPGDDFNAYANAGWVKSTPIPQDKSSYGIFTILADRTRDRLRTLIEDAAKNPGNNADARRVAAFYTAFQDEAAIEQKGLTPLKPRLDAYAALADKKALAATLGAEIRADVDPLNATNFETSHLFGVFVAQGLNDPAKNYPYLLQGGLGLPDRDFYLSDSPHMAAVRTQYQQHLTALFRLANLSEPEARAARVFALETKLAKAHATRTESQEVHNVALWSRAELEKKAPGLDWPTLLTAAGLDKAPQFHIWHAKALPGLAALVASEPLAAWQDWLTFHALDDNTAFLPKAFVEQGFAFHGKALNGIPQLRPRWQRAVDFTNGALGDIVGRLYVARYFPPETKAKVEAMVKDIVAAFDKRVDNLAWMTPETKAKAKEKLKTIKVCVGYPDRWPDDAALEVQPGDALGNLERAGLFAYRRQLAKLTQPVQKDEWWMTPQTVNAVNLPLQNALNFPAAILEPPYFDPAADAAHNYGSMGAIIGHEISHSFDDQGALFDAQGRLANWWTPADLDHFKKAGEALAAQFSAYKAFPDLALDGRQTLSENIADVAGLLAAYDAYRLSLQGKPDETKDGFTGDQRFFLSYAQSWRTNSREAALRRAIATDGHAPGQFRALTVRNLDAWYEAFQVPATAKLYLAPDQRIRVW